MTRRRRQQLAAYEAWCARVGANPMAPAALADRFDDGGDATRPGMQVGPYLVTVAEMDALAGRRIR
jgi:hypothetical protein